ncbi:hypothetical protein [Chromobacterium haemolyticum]|uniref:hypothetical protein n=1 Tax=Chromobacterium haemolyticum TaxID=394935 RepID=UPI000D327463|nr:hypothetical protein [Chromobacterium haemolyticum]PTU70958.1 hypothetical protein DBB33_16585 [Chromobacterium haemolyticum]
MRSLIQAGLIGVSVLAGASVQVAAAPVNNSYIQSSANEIRGFLGGYARPTVYVNQYACRESQLSAMACGPYTISVGTGFLQQQENSYGNYVAKFILAHEWGHSIQFTHNIYRQAPMQELQADCVGGTFAKYAETNLRYPSFIENAVASARNAADYGEHGTPSQRDYYSRYGHAKGLNACLNSI